GGQTLISEATRREVGPILKLGRQMEVKAKGIEYPITVSEVLGIGRPYQLYLPDIAEDLVPLAAEVPLTYSVIDSNQAGGELYSGALTKLSKGRKRGWKAPLMFSATSKCMSLAKTERVSEALFTARSSDRFRKRAASSRSASPRFPRRSSPFWANCLPKRPLPSPLPQ